MRGCRALLEGLKGRRVLSSTFKYRILSIMGHMYNECKWKYKMCWDKSDNFGNIISIELFSKYFFLIKGYGSHWTDCINVFLGGKFYWEGGRYFPKIVINLPRSYEKLPRKGELQRFSGSRNPMVQTNRQT